MPSFKLLSIHIESYLSRLSISSMPTVYCICQTQGRAPFNLLSVRIETPLKVKLLYVNLPQCYPLQGQRHTTSFRLSSVRIQTPLKVKLLHVNLHQCQNLQGHGQGQGHDVIKVVGGGRDSAILLYSRSSFREVDGNKEGVCVLSLKTS